jgi:hypothetical protein
MLDRDRLHVADAESSLRVDGNAVEREGPLEAERSSSEDAFITRPWLRARFVVCGRESCAGR